MTHATVDASAPASYTPHVQSAPAADTRSCPSCRTDAIGAFCHACGARTATSRLTLRALAAELVAQFVELDHGLLHTLVTLIKRPGAMIRGYFAGQRRGFTAPLTFIALSVAFSLLMSNALPQYRAARDEQLKALDQYRHLYSPAQFELFAKIEHTVIEDKTLVLVALLIPVSLALRFVFRKQRLNLAEIGTIVCYTYGLATFVTVAISAPIALTGRTHFESAISMVLMIAFVIHVSFGVFGKSFSTTWRALWGNLLGLLLMQGTLMALPYLLAAGGK